MKLSEIVVTQVAEDIEGTGPVEVKDIVAGRNPKFAKQYLSKLWGKDNRLVFNGKPFFGAGDTVYDDIQSALKQALEDHTVEVNLPVQGTDELDMDTFRFDAKVNDHQEVYLGYDSKRDALFVGVDAWISDEEFNDAWDEEFEKATGQEFDHGDPEHAAVFDSAWKAYQKMGFYGILIELTGDPIDNGDIVEERSGGFYAGIHRSASFKTFGLVDLRLD